GGLARRGAAAAAPVADAILGLIGEVGVAGAVLVPHVAVVFRARIDVLYLERDRRAGGQELAALFEHAGENLHRIRLAPLGGEARLARPPLFHVGLDLGLRDRDARRAAVDHAADGRSMAFAPGRHPEKMTE